MTASSPAVAGSNSLARSLRVTGLAVGAVLIYLIVLWRALEFAGELTAGNTMQGAIGAALTRFDDVANAYLAQALQQTANALSIGAIYALIALGYTMVYGIIELINFAHGDIFMLGSMLSVAFLAGLLHQQDGVTNVLLLAVLLLAALAVVMPIVGLINVFIERAVYRPLRHAPRLAPLITAVGVSFIIQNIVLTLAGSGDRASPQIFPDWKIPFGGAEISVLSIFIFVLSLGLMIGLQNFVGRTRMGRAMRATAQDQSAASLMGVDLNQTIALTFLLGGMLAGAAGVAWGLRFGFVRFDLGFNSGLKAFTAAVLGGIGNIQGAVLGGFIIGFIENFASSLGYSRWSEFLVFMVLTFVLIFKPSGILGQLTGDRA
ncbi:MAG: branched-chain amino acid transport system permease protein [Chloroflexota bacterium]|nr:branched-chain amino acid transport system permease protein [Chloroflexota bacterium]MEA2607616.1 branched-chain amino acid transport system permease protein [Chloroflexota bacterium]